MTDDWVKMVNLDIFECAKKMMMPGKQLRQKETGEYESQILITSFRIMALMLNRIFGRADGTLYKVNWIPLIYYVAFEGTYFNWTYIISDSLSSYVDAARGGITQKRSKFYMSSYLIDCILCKFLFAKIGYIWTQNKTLMYVAYQIL